MKATTIFLVSMLLAFSAHACDEACAKEKAERANNIKFASYLNWGFCEDTRMDFMTNSMQSLQKYSGEHFNTRYKGGMRNIKKYVETRIDWLKECNDYMSLTGKGPLFDDERTTQAIFASMHSIVKELNQLISQVGYDGENGVDSSTVIRERFSDLFVRVDNHKSLMHLKGRYVTR